MALQQNTVPDGDSSVFVFLGSDEAIEQPQTFRCCPLGVQFYAPESVEKYRILSIRLQIPGEEQVQAEIECSGIVVYSQQDDSNGLYRTWVYFLDLPEEVRDYIHCAAKDADTLCPFCENF
jgi:hypothetical protein